MIDIFVNKPFGFLETKEIITIHIGQAWIQMAHPLWELVCLEHNIKPNGEILVNNEDNSSLLIMKFFSVRMILER